MFNKITEQCIHCMPSFVKFFDRQLWQVSVVVTASTWFKSLSS